MPGVNLQALPIDPITIRPGNTVADDRNQPLCKYGARDPPAARKRNSFAARLRFEGDRGNVHRDATRISFFFFSLLLFFFLLSGANLFAARINGSSGKRRATPRKVSRRACGVDCSPSTTRQAPSFPVLVYLAPPRPTTVDECYSKRVFPKPFLFSLFLVRSARSWDDRAPVNGLTYRRRVCAWHLGFFH